MCVLTRVFNLHWTLGSPEARWMVRITRGGDLKTSQAAGNGHTPSNTLHQNVHDIVHSHGTAE